VPQGVRVRVSPPALFSPLKPKPSIMNTVKDLLEVLLLEKKDDFFIGKSETVGSLNVFGGQVLAQSLNAAYRTIHNNRILHSLHSYFLEPGDLKIPIKYQVNDTRDGGSFSTRRVTAIQGDKTIFILAASFHKKEFGFEHFRKLEREVLPPEKLTSWSQMANKFGKFIPFKLKSFLSVKRPIEFRPTFIPNLSTNQELPPKMDVWFKLKGDIPDLSIGIKHQILTYISDYSVLWSSVLPHINKVNFSDIQMASLDHAMWFYRDFDFTDWLLYTIESPNSANARGIAQGHIYTRNGILIASVVQEGLVRPIIRKK
jgi:acyl-CoA thioesterase-2